MRICRKFFRRLLRIKVYYSADTPSKHKKCPLYEKVKAQLEQLRATKAAREAQAEAIGAFMFEIQELDALTEFDEKLWLTVIDTVTVHADGRLTFKFQGGSLVAV